MPAAPIEGRERTAGPGGWLALGLACLVLGTSGCNCDPGPCGGGTLQLEAAAVRVSESAGSVTLGVTRTGGSQGAVSATLTVSGGTATPGLDYQPLTTTVSFAAGELGARRVNVTLLPDSVAEPDETVQVALSNPAGCVELGSPASATITLLDDDGVPDGGPDGGPVVGPDGGQGGELDPSFGGTGRAIVHFGGKNTGMAVQADGKVVMVGGSFAGFLAARFLADGGLDPEFADGGLLTTLIPGQRQQQARAVALQADGKAVVVGENRPGLPGDDFDFTLLRYQLDGSLDRTFGDGGIVTATGVTGRAFAVAVQPDGKLVLAGDETASQAVRVARFHSDGTLDTGFGTLGQVTAIVAGAHNQASNVALYPDGRILVSGDPIGQLDQPTAVVRLTPQGQLDPSFGDGGTLAISVARVGAGLALQPDGKVVLVGSVETAVPPLTRPRFAVVRLLDDGSTDPAFGDGGVVITGFKTEGDQARAVTVRPDGKLLVAGQVDLVNSDFGVARYLPDGQLDLGFGTQGKVSFDFQSFNDGAEHVALGPDGKLVLGGFAGTVSRTGYGVARLLP